MTTQILKEILAKHLKCPYYNLKSELFCYHTLVQEEKSLLAIDNALNEIYNTAIEDCIKNTKVVSVEGITDDYQFDKESLKKLKIK